MPVSGDEKVKGKVGVKLLPVKVVMTAWLPALKYGLVSHVGWTLAYVFVELTGLGETVPTVMNWDVV